MGACHNKQSVNICLEASEQVSLKETATPEGSSFSVRNLFYNVPARRKFLPSPRYLSQAS